MRKKILYLFIVMLSLFSFISPIEAASLNVSVNTQTVVTGGNVTVTVNASGLAGKFSITSSNGNVLSGGTSSVWLENETKTYKFSAKSVGTAKIEVIPIDVADSNGNVFSGRKSVTVNVVKPREKSSNNNLKSLSVEGYELSPGFSKDILEYTVNLESNIEKINIHADKEDGYASLEGTGEKEVQEGDNKFEIVVTAETGNKKVYTVNAIVQDRNPIIKEIAGENYTVIKRASTLTKPDSFIDTKVIMNEVEIPAFINETLNLTLIGLKDNQGNIGLYKYNPSTTECEEYSSLNSKSQTIILEETVEEKYGFTKEKIKIQEKDYTVYQSNYNKDYVLFYGTDLETGKKNWYLYNIQEESIQLYMEDMVKQLETDHDKKLNEYKVILLGISGLSLLLLLIVIIQMIVKGKMKRKLLKRIYALNEEIEKKKSEKLEKEDHREKKKGKEDSKEKSEKKIISDSENESNH